MLTTAQKPTPKQLQDQCYKQATDRGLLCFSLVEQIKNLKNLQLIFDACTVKKPATKLLNKNDLAHVVALKNQQMITLKPLYGSVDSNYQKLETILDEVNNKKQRTIHRHDNRKQAENCYFYVGRRLTYDGLQEYMTKEFEYSVCCNVQTIMLNGINQQNADPEQTIGNKIQKQMYRRMTEASRAKGPVSAASSSVRSKRYERESVSISTGQVGRHQLRAQYNKIIYDYQTSQADFQTENPKEKLSEKLRDVTKNRAWQILLAQLKPRKNTLMILEQDSQKRAQVETSIRLLSEDFRKKSGLTGTESPEKAEHIARDDYLVGDLMKNVTDFNGHWVWASIYIYFRAGLLESIEQVCNFYKRLGFTHNMDQFIGDFRKYNNGEPISKVSQKYHHELDPFYQALYFIFRKEGTLHEQLMRKDFLFFTLKTIYLEEDDDIESPAISTSYRHSSGTLTLKEAQAAIRNYYEHNPTLQNFYNLLYCMDYETALNSELCGQYIDEQSSLHMEILLNQYALEEELGGIRVGSVGHYHNKVIAYSDTLLNISPSYSRSGVNTEALKTCLSYLLLLGNQSYGTHSIPEIIYEKLNDTGVVDELLGNPPRSSTPYLDMIRRYLEPRKTRVSMNGGSSGLSSNMERSKDQYKNFISRVAEQYVQRLKKYVYPALIYKNILGNHEKSCELLLTMQLADLASKREISAEEQKDAQNLINEYVSKCRGGSIFGIGSSSNQLPAYLESFQIMQWFISHYNKLSDSLAKHDLKSLKAELYENENSRRFVPKNGKDLPPGTQPVLLGLQNAGYLYFYLRYVQLVMYGLELVATYDRCTKPQGSIKQNLSQLLKTLKTNNIFRNEYAKNDAEMNKRIRELFIAMDTYNNHLIEQN